MRRPGSKNLPSYTFLRDKYVRNELPWAALSTKSPTTWRRLLQGFRAPATESQIGIVLGFSIVMLSLMMCVIVWQAQVISQQAELIRWLRTLKLGG